MMATLAPSFELYSTKRRTRMFSLKARSASLSILESVASHHHRHRVQQCRELRWVPLAYRGARGHPSSAPRHPRRRPPRRGRRPASKSRSGFGGDRATDPRKETAPSGELAEEKLRGLHGDLLRLARSYSAAFSADQLPFASRRDGPGIINVAYEDHNDERRAILRAMARDVRALSRELHQADQLVEVAQLDRSDASFRDLSRVLQEMIRHAVATHKSRSAEAVREELVGLAEVALGAVVKLGSERTLLVELTKTWSTIQKSQFSSLWPVTSLKELFGRLLSAGGSAETEERQESRALAHQDPLISSPELFRDVLDAIAWSVKSKLDPCSSEELGSRQQSHSLEPVIPVDIDRVEVEATARRMVALLDVMPSSWAPDLESMKDILEMLCRAGTLASARLCYDTFKRNLVNQNRLRFSLVLQSYLEATKHDPDDKKRVTAAQEAVAALHREWNSNLPRHRVERIVHGSIVLSCLSVPERSKKLVVKNVCELAERIVKRCLGRAGFESSLEDEKGKALPPVDPQTFPVITCLVRIYAESGDQKRVKQARKLLSYMMKHDKEAVSPFMSYPLLDTFNAVLASVVAEFEGKKKKHIELQDGLEALEYSTSLLDYMLKRRDSGCWPNETTFKLLFRILTSVDPPDIGERGEEVLSMLDVRAYFAHCRTDDPYEALLSVNHRVIRKSDPFEASLAMYHYALRCWLRAAEKQTTEGAAVRAWKLLEKLEMQSTPLLLSDREVQQRWFRRLYDVRLRPTGNTYRLVQQICVATANPQSFTDACEVALKVHQRLRSKGMLALDGSDDRNLAFALQRLPPDSAARRAAEDELGQFPVRADDQGGVAASS